MAHVTLPQNCTREPSRCRYVGLELLAIHVEPAALLAHKAAALMQARSPPAVAVTRYKLHLGMFGVHHVVRAHLQPQPLGGGLQRW